ncbi:MAG: hypothetical protein H6974_11520 [Gammaproteobacteria bacterium]|nr:hypothetical protein [Gammaproteobacteria bacterium]
MQIPKLKILAEAGAVREVEAMLDLPAGWIVWITYATRSGEQREALERQRGGARVFTTLDAVARCLAGLGLPGFRVNSMGLSSEEPP